MGLAIWAFPRQSVPAHGEDAPDDNRQGGQYGRPARGGPTSMNMQMPPPQIGAASRWRVWLVSGVVLAALAGGYWYFGQDSAPVRKRSTVIPVKVGLVERRDMAVVEHTLGTVVPFTIVQVAARVQGVIDSTSFKEGQFVKAGDLLFVIDPRPYQAAYDNALATLATSTA